MEMGPTFHSSGTSVIGGLAVLSFLFGLGITIFWMVVGWRAMRAHEKLADATEEIARRQS